MKCAWESFIKILPAWLRGKVDELGRDSLRELRLRINAPPELVFADKSIFFDRCITMEDLQFCINLATRYSPWSSETAAEGFITIPGGHRIGLCGVVIPCNEQKGFRSISSICIRISRDFPGIAKAASMPGSTLVIGSPGSGKTTFLRDLVREIAAKDRNRVAVVDERYEIFPQYANSFCFDTGSKVDVLSGCKKSLGIEMVLRAMTPTVIAVDEITAQTDVNAIIHSVGCGVSLLATAHAGSIAELNMRPLYRTLLEHAIFQWVVVLHIDMSWHMECLKK